MVARGCSDLNLTTHEGFTASKYSDYGQVLEWVQKASNPSVGLVLYLRRGASVWEEGEEGKKEDEGEGGVQCIRTATLKPSCVRHMVLTAALTWC